MRKFFDVFLDHSPSLPSNREIEFEIYLMPRVGPISKSTYRMAPAEFI